MPHPRTAIIQEECDANVDADRVRVHLPDGWQDDRMANPRTSVHRIKVTLRGSRPPIWRRLEVPSSATLQQVHHMVQEAFGWQDSHLWVFETPAGDFGIPDPELGYRSAAAKKLRDVAPRPRTASATPTTSATAGSTTSSSRPSTPPNQTRPTPSAWQAAAPARPRTAEASGATRTCCGSSPTPQTTNTKTAWNGSAWTAPTSSTPWPSISPQSTLPSLT
ncbi:hypothetical protein ABIA32_003319 [Streptacidiphilus sp. MAP12-20]